MFFVRQKANQCGLHAIQNMLKSAAITNDDMRRACDNIHKETGDLVHNHETFGGDWSVSAVIQALQDRGYSVQRAVSTTKSNREWSVESMDDLLKDKTFRGFILHQPMRKHFTCMRPETVDGAPHMYYVDSQSAGPIRISSRLAMRRCLAQAYAWEPYMVKGEEIEYVAPEENAMSIYHGISHEKNEDPPFIPSEEFLRQYRSLRDSRASTEPVQRPHIAEPKNAPALGPPVAYDI